MWRRLAGRLLPQSARQAWLGTAAGAGAGSASTSPPAAAALARQELQQRQQQTQQLFAWLQSAGVRTSTRHAPRHAHPHSRRRALRRAAVATSGATALAVVGLPAAAAAALVFKGREDADVAELLRSLPRTARVVWWGLWAGFKYKALSMALASRYGADTASPDYQRALAELHEHAASRLLLVCQANGGLYIKAGQLAVALHAVPVQYRRTLEALQDRVPPRPFTDIEQVLLQELGAPPEVLFAEFDQAATAAASLAQVHKARLHDGTQVAVKYPGLRACVEADLATMLILADAGHRLFPATSWRWLFEELQKQLQYELDFRNEAANAARLAACMAGRPDVAAPATFPTLCTPRVLCMEWVEGCRLTDLDCLIQQGLEPRQVGILLLDAFAQSTFSCGWTHGDPHPGNILVRVRADPPPLLARLLLGAGSRPRPQLVMLDHGIYFRLPDDLRRLYCQLWCAIVLGDMETARAAAAQLGGERAGRILPEVLRPRNWAAVPREERRRVRQESGINSFADLANLLEEAPRPLLDSLRQSAVVRHSATALGATLADRLRINATWALRGMWRAGQDGGGAAGELRFVGSLQSRLKRWRVAFQVHLLRLAFWVVSAAHQVLTAVVPSVA